ncbi:hypothetical protein BDZ45DRAFT_476239 [Acephala macrosclerotiorum]|nr:hypothetical protein BDZ45DRAFT_476239 [Acephala macrosclerotiorum]
MEHRRNNLLRRQATTKEKKGPPTNTERRVAMEEMDLIAHKIGFGSDELALHHPLGNIKRSRNKALTNGGLAPTSRECPAAGAPEGADRNWAFTHRIWLLCHVFIQASHELGVRPWARRLGMRGGLEIRSTGPELPSLAGMTPHHQPHHLHLELHN